MTRYLAALMLSFVVLATPQFAAADPAEVVIGGRSAQIELPDGYCAMSTFDPADARLVEFLTEVNRGTNTVHLAFAECGQLQVWRNGDSNVLSDDGCIATQTKFDNTPINMTRSDYVELMSQYFSGQGAIDLEHGLEEGETRVRNLVPELEIGETQNLGDLSEDGYAIYLGLVQKFQIRTGEQFIVLGS